MDIADTAADELVSVALMAARAAGQLLVNRQNGARAVAAKSSPTDPVTEADRAAERLLVDLVRTRRPHDGVLAEEGTELPGTTGLRWVIDPLDGTVNYLYGRPSWTVSLAVEDAAGELVGVVLDPVHREAFHAVRGRGAYLGAERLRVRDPVPAAMALLAIGFSYDPQVRRRQAGRLVELLPAVRDIRRLGTCAGDLCGLAAGRVDGFLEDDLAPWDWAAGALIAREAGATVTPLHGGTATGPTGPGGPARSRTVGLLAAGPSLHSELSRLLTSLMESQHSPSIAGHTTAPGTPATTRAGSGYPPVTQSGSELLGDGD
jgi:myo-inositol-1(or 4)-monophosphatase